MCHAVPKGLCSGINPLQSVCRLSYVAAPGLYCLFMFVQPTCYSHPPQSFDVNGSAIPIHRKASMSTGQPDLRYLENNKLIIRLRTVAILNWSLTDGGVKPHESNQPMLFKGVNPTRNAQPSMFLLCACVHHLNGSWSLQQLYLRLFDIKYISGNSTRGNCPLPQGVELDANSMHCSEIWQLVHLPFLKCDDVIRVPYRAIVWQFGSIVWYASCITHDIDFS